MSQAIEVIGKLKEYKQCSLDDLLIKLCHLGDPSISKMRKGWWCRVDMHVASKGTRFTVESECDRPSPLEAAHQCAERAIEILKQWS